MRASLRSMVTGVVVAVALLPVPAVLALNALGEAREAGVERETFAAAQEARALIERGVAPRPAAARVAARRSVRLRVLGASDAPLADVDRDARVARYGALSSTSGDGDEALGAHEARGPTGGARGGGGHDRVSCASLSGGSLWVCDAFASTSDRRRVVWARRSVSSEARRFAKRPRPLLWLTGFALLSGVALAAWLVARVVGPLDALRAALARRASAPGEAVSPLTITSPPEIAEVVDAYNDALRALDAARGERERRAAELVHEIKGPLSAIRLALERAPDATRSDGALAAVGRIDHTVGMLLELARAEAGLPDEARAPLDLRALSEGVASTLAPEDVAITVTGDVVFVCAAEGSLARALGCVLENACSFASSSVSVEVARRGERATLTVTDDGPGIDPAHLPRIFERFFSARRERGGTGVGLALARAVVESHGGAIVAKNAPGGGACFELSLPRPAGDA